MSFSVTVRWPGMTDGEVEEFGTDAHDLAKWLFGLAGSRWQRARIRWWGWGDLVDVLVLDTIDDADVAWMPFDRVEAVVTSFRNALLDGDRRARKVAARYSGSWPETSEEELAQRLADLLTMIEQAREEGHEQLAIEIG